MSDRFDVIVVGAGSMGAAACLELARRGVKVLGLERFDLTHGMGSYGGHSRMYRESYFEHPDYVPLLVESGRMWEAMGEESGVKLLHRVGGLYLGERDGGLVGGSIGAAERHGLDHEVLDAGEVKKRWPQFEVGEGRVGFYEKGAGYVLSELAVGVMIDVAMRAGAVFRGRERVVDWSVNPAGVTVRTEKGVFCAGRVVFCAGAWTGGLLRELGLGLSVTRQVMGWMQPREMGMFGGDRFPCWAADEGGEGVLYGFPMISGAPGLKVARHRLGEVCEAESVNRGFSVMDEDDFRPAVKRLLPGGVGTLVAGRVCMYTNTADGHFVVDKHPVHEGIVLGAGFSGHGFKFAPVIGKALADLALDGNSELPIGFLGLGRFG